ncbi:cell envelope integrity protein TolA [Aestuariirhabdus sp. Z084]|uniref:cell envelope integrity protein TolA n=1 Tax=Aestuariirhabdus haliotis TaxID=2918751 RepID=UPI00201B3CE5|nr:cell envelope integrity protein TolA [Aestuariirhabdus haliotis]MCL6416325.1 cell envelope integrity protein TolA [Aestuariirhabdus haliotis]MCL6420198.1 cell envelope integrity protein TolA [Aestuariirhabdus haliotis]
MKSLSRLSGGGGFRLPNGYGLPIILALVLHLAAASALLVAWPASEPLKMKPVPTHVKASLVEIKPKSKPAPKKKAVKPQVKKKAPTKKPKVDKQAEQKKKEIALKRKREAEAKKKAEAERKAKKKKEAERKAREKKAAELRRQQELQKQKQQQEREQELAALLESEAAFEQEQQQAASDFEVAMSYADLIREQVIPHWSRPPSARNGMVSVLQISLVPTGEVVDVNVIKSSGDKGFDQSTLRAVRRAGRFPELQQIEPRVFEKYFRKLRIEFKPEDLIR